jgi:hypothetical protein
VESSGAKLFNYRCFPEGSALKYLAAYFTDECPENPYVENPLDVRCVSFEPNGGVLGGECV